MTTTRTNTLDRGGDPVLVVVHDNDEEVDQKRDPGKGLARHATDRHRQVNQAPAKDAHTPRVQHKVGQRVDPARVFGQSCVDGGRVKVGNRTITKKYSLRGHPASRGTNIALARSVHAAVVLVEGLQPRLVAVELHKLVRPVHEHKGQEHAVKCVEQQELLVGSGSHPASYGVSCGVSCKCV